MPIPVQEIVDRVTDLLLDKDRADDEARWSNLELFRWVNDSRTAILIRRPTAGARLVSRPLIAGTYQTIPADGVQLLDIIRNMGADGQTPGRAVRRTDRQAIDDMDQDWHSAPPSGIISQFTLDDRSPKAFFVSPPAIAGTHVHMLYSAIPAAVDSLGDSLDFAEEYIDAVVNYVCYRAKSKDSEYANAAEAAAFYAAFNDSLGVGQQVQTANSPNQPGNSV